MLSDCPRLVVELGQKKKKNFLNNVFSLLLDFKHLEWKVYVYHRALKV